MRDQRDVLMHGERGLSAISRRQFIKRSVLVGASISSAASLLVACGSGAENPPDSEGGSGGSGGQSDSTEGSGSATTTTGGSTESAGEPVQGGKVIVAMIGEPPTLDIHQTTGTIVALVAWNMYETLFSWDADYNNIPMLAESHEVSDDGKLIKVQLRQGVPFHNGEEMTAKDVIASIQRWGKINGLGQSLLEATGEMVDVDDYTIELHLNKPFGIFTSALALINGGCAIYPKSVIDKSDDASLAEIVGTGPYKFVDRQADAYIRLERFADYAALAGEPNGYGGRKLANVDQIEFIPVPDESARIAGLQAGDYHYLENVSPDQYEILKDDPTITAEVLPPLSWGIFILSWESPIMGNLKIRQAFQAALDHEPIAAAGYGQGFYRLDPSLMQKETVWHSTEGEELYNRRDPDLARQLLQEAGYNGEEIKWTCTQEYQDHYNRSVVAAEQLKEVGFNINLVVMDWATVLSQQFDKTAWDVTTTGITFRPDPALLFIMDVCNVAGWWCSEETVDLVEQLRSEADFDTRFAIWEKIQRNAYEEVPFIKVADAKTVKVRSSTLKNLSQQAQLGPILWNVWLET